MGNYNLIYINSFILHSFRMQLIDSSYNKTLLYLYIYL